MPIKHELHPIKDYALPEFHDYNVLSQDFAQTYRIPILDGAQAEHGCVFEHIRDVDDRPWDQSPVSIRVGEHELAPLGCTVLRRSTLPLQTKS